MIADFASRWRSGDVPIPAIAMAFRRATQYALPFSALHAPGFAKQHCFSPRVSHVEVAR